MPAGDVPLPGAAGGADRAPVSSSAKDARLTPWPTLVALVMGAAMGGQVLYFFGWLATILWLAAILGVHIPLIRNIARLRANQQAGTVAPTLSISIVALLLVWTACAIALWTTHNSTGWVSAMTITLVLPFHLVCAGQRHIRATLILLAIPLTPVVCFILYAMWTAYPTWLAIAATVSSLCAVAGIGGAAVMVNRNFVQLQASMTVLRITEIRLEAAIEQAEASSRAKSEFLANMSHEIRTPLNGLLGMAQSLAQDPLESAQLEKIAIILDSGRSLTALLNDVLDLSKIEAGKLEVAPIADDMRSTIGRSAQLFETLAAEKGLELSIRYEAGLQQRLVYDPARVRQCVSNLLSNAIKFTERGRIEVVVSSAALEAGVREIAISIADSGIGMTAEVQAKLFSAFTQADGATTRKFGGTGLGLVISRQLARLMGGDLTVESEVGRGSVFRLTFKATESSEAAATQVSTTTSPKDASAPPASPAGLRGKRILLTDDNAINRQVVKLFLGPQGCVITEAANGREVLDKLALHAFDIVLLDVHMPVMDGVETIRRIRASEEPWSRLPVIALTADAMNGDRERFLAMGMTDYVSKPIDQRELIDRIHKALGYELDAAPLLMTRTKAAAV